jgi:TM2 domain-containing membrane protein YozV
MFCPRCGRQVADGSAFCPGCGSDLRATGTPVGSPPGSIHPVTASGLPAPYGVDPITGKPFSDKSKLGAGLLQILLPLGIGRFYTGHTGIGVAQLVVTLLTCGVGGIWPLVDGIVLLATNPTDANGRPLRP